MRKASQEWTVQHLSAWLRRRQGCMLDPALMQPVARSGSKNVAATVATP